MRRTFYNTVILLLLTYLVIGIFLSINTGISHDEFHEQLNWEVNFKSIKEFILTGTYDELLNYKDKYHGVGLNFLSQPFQYLTAELVSNYLNINKYGGVLISKHIFIFILFFISGLFFYSICRILFKDKKFAIISLLFFYFYPYLFGHAQFNPKDIPFLSFWLINTYLIIKVIKNLFNEKKITYKILFYLSLSTSVLISIRIAGLLILLQYFIFLIFFIELKKKSFINFIKLHRKNIFLFFLLITIFTFFLNPILWHNPLELLNSLKWMSKYQQDICTLTLGNCMKSLNLPASYYFIWLFFKLPILIIIGFLLFPVIEKKLSNNLLNKTLIYSILTTILSILILFIVLNVAIYDELRHVMFLIPLIFIIALHNLYSLNHNFFCFSCVFVILFFTIENFSLNPYQYTWLNSFSKFYKINKTFEVDYWGISGKNLYKSINKHSSDNNFDKNNCIYGGTYSKVFLENHGFKCFKLYSELDNAKHRPYYVMKNLRNFKRSDPKNCKLIDLENYNYTFGKEKINVGSAWYCN